MGQDPQTAADGPEKDSSPRTEKGDDGERAVPRKPAAIPKPTKPLGLVRRRISVQDLKRDQSATVQPDPGGGQGPGGLESPPRRPAGEAERPEARAGRPAGPAGSKLGLQTVRHPDPRHVTGEAGVEGAPPPHKPIGARDAFAANEGRESARAGVVAGPAGRRRRMREAEGEDSWTGSRISLWFVMAGLLCVVVVGYFLTLSFGQAEAPPKHETPPRTAVKATIDEIPIAEFVERSEELLPIVAGVLEEAEESEGEVLANLVRGGAESVARMKAWRERGSMPARHRPVKGRQLHAAAVGETGYLVLAGLNAENLVAAAYFVKEGEQFKYDWEASEGFSEVLPSEVEQWEGTEPMLMRVVVSVSTFYPEAFPERRYRCYSFHHQDPGDFVWGFAERDSLVDRSLGASYLAPDMAGTEGRATVRVRKGPAGARANQLEVVEFLHTDWITP